MTVPTLNRPTFRIGLDEGSTESLNIWACLQSRRAENATIRDMLRADENRYETNCNWEAENVISLYKLEFFADHHYQKSPKKANVEYRLGMRARFEDHFVLDEPNSYDFGAIVAQNATTAGVHTAQTFFEIERMIYSLLQEPE